MQITQVTKHEKVPVLKNIVFAAKLVWKCDRNLLLGYLLNLVASQIFARFLQNILFLKVLLNIIEANGDFKLYVRYLILFLVLSLITKGCQWLGEYMHQNATKRVLKALNNIVFEKAAQLDVSCYEDPSFYDKYQRATNVLTNGYFDVFCWDLASAIGSVISFICVIVTITAIDPVLLIFLIPVLLVFVIEMAKSKCVYRRDLEMTTNNRVKAYIQRTVFLRDFSKDMRTSNIFYVLMKRFEGAIEANIVILKKYGFRLFVYSMVSSLFSEFIPVIGTYTYAAYQFMHSDKMSISGFSVVLSSINSVREVTLDISECVDELNQMSLYFQNLRDFLDYEPKIISGSKKAGAFESLEFRNVSFKYPSADKYSLNRVNLKITKGETVAVVGINGAGKSTLVKLLLRFYDPDEGQILYNGTDIREYELEAYRDKFATVFQDYKNFAISVFENVMCRACSQEDRQLAEDALRKSGVWEKISSLENGGDTVLTREFDENGAGLSGGENQKVSTARLFARDFDIAVLDEPSSALDPIAEYRMYENLIRATADKTVIYISHRLSSAVLSDNIFVLDNGTVMESGSHSQLMQSGGAYSEMFELQSKSYKEAENNA